MADKIFKVYDIRGIYPKELNQEIVFNIAGAFGLFLKKKIKKAMPKIVISSDFRLSSPNLKKAFIKGLLNNGIKVFDIGFSTTPMNYFAINFLKTDGGAIITASHNPKEYNGIKMSFKKAIPIGKDNGLKEIKKIFQQNYKIQSSKFKIYGRVIKKNLVNEYVNFLLKRGQMLNVKCQISVVIDCGNGAVGYILSKLLKKAGIRYYPLYFKPDGKFPNRSPNPLKENALNKLKKKVLNKKADLGIAFDGDGDRVYFIDEKGNFISPDFILGLLIKDALKNNPKTKTILDIKSSRSVREFIKQEKGAFIFSKTGHSFFKQMMRKEKADLGGELSGHYYFKDFFFCDSGILAMLRVLKILSTSNKKISEIIKPFKKYYQSGEINFKVANKEKTIKNIKKYFKSLKIKNLKIFNFDGLNIATDDFWFNLRPSNTEPLLRLNLEATTKTILNKKLKTLTRLIK